jgi:hypothetical protein
MNSPLCLLRSLWSMRHASARERAASLVEIGALNENTILRRRLAAARIFW